MLSLRNHARTSRAVAASAASIWRRILMSAVAPLVAAQRSLSIGVYASTVRCYLCVRRCSGVTGRSPLKYLSRRVSGRATYVRSCCPKPHHYQPTMWLSSRLVLGGCVIAGHHLGVLRWLHRPLGRVVVGEAAPRPAGAGFRVSALAIPRRKQTANTNKPPPLPCAG